MPRAAMTGRRVSRVKERCTATQERVNASPIQRVGMNQNSTDALYALDRELEQLWGMRLPANGHSRLTHQVEIVFTNCCHPHDLLRDAHESPYSEF
jgi:hypothetical protein